MNTHRVYSCHQLPSGVIRPTRRQPSSSRARTVVVVVVLILMPALVEVDLSRQTPPATRQPTMGIVHLGLYRESTRYMSEKGKHRVHDDDDDDDRKGG